MFLAIGHDPLAERRSPDGSDLLGDLSRGHEEKAVELSREGMLRTIFIGRGGAHCDQLALRTELGQGRRKLVANCLGRLYFFDGCADLGCVVRALEGRAQLGCDARVKGVGHEGHPRRNRQTGLSECGQRTRLAAEW